MSEKLDKLTIKLCKNLPLNFTFYEKKGFCEKPNKDCDYCRKNGNNLYFCYKKTYVLNQELNLV